MFHESNSGEANPAGNRIALALVACKDCGTEIHRKAESCPRCGRRQERRSALRRAAPYLVAGFCVLLLIAVIGVFLEERSRSADQQAMLAAILGTLWPVTVVALVVIIVLVIRN
jgi:uncharacterized paraquat-inducible protein A